jgi:hypothetical protein
MIDLYAIPALLEVAAEAAAFEYMLNFGALDSWICRPGDLDAGCWQDWAWVPARWPEGLEEIPTCSTPQEVGGLQEGNSCKKQKRCVTGKEFKEQIHVFKFQERHQCRKKGARGSWQDLNQFVACHKNHTNTTFAEKTKEALAAPLNTSPSSIHVTRF